MKKVNKTDQQNQVNQSQPLATERSETLRAAQGDGQSCVAGEGEYAVGDKVVLLKDIWDDGADHHPPGYLAHKGETLIVRAFDKGHEFPVCVSHEEITDRSFRVALDELAHNAAERETENSTKGKLRGFGFHLT